MKTKIGVPSLMALLPLNRWLATAKNFEPHTGSMVDLARKLRRRELDAAFVSPLEYARESSVYRILPGFALSSRSGIALHFHEHLHRISTMAANPADVSEIVLARIVLAEEFDTAPPIVPLPASRLPEMLGKADSALMTGDAQFLQGSEDYHSLDIAEAWSEMVDLPYTHGVLCAPEGAVPPEAIREIASNDWNDVSTRVLETDLPGEARGRATLSRADVYLRQYSFALNEAAEEGLMEFLRYAHYHGIIADIPLFRMYPTEGKEDDDN